MKLLKAQISELEAQEKELDNQKAWLEENIKLLNHDPITRTYLFMLAIIRRRCLVCDYFFIFSPVQMIVFFNSFNA